MIHDLYGKSSAIPRYAPRKLIRWEIKLSELRYVIRHESGERNKKADILTRWPVQKNGAMNVRSFLG